MFLVTYLFLSSCVMQACENKNSLQQILDTQWLAGFRKINRLQETQEIARQQLAQPDPKIFSDPILLYNCYQQRAVVVHNEIHKLGRVSRQISDMLARSQARDSVFPSKVTQETNSVEDCSTCCTTKISSLSPLTLPSRYADVVKRGRTDSLSSISDVTVSDNLSIQTPVSKDQTRKIVDPQVGLTRFQAVLRGAYVRDNLAATQRQLLYEKEKKQQSRLNVTALSGSASSNAKGLKSKRKSQISQQSLKIEKEKEDLLLQQAVDQSKQDQFFVEHPGISDLIARHVSKLVVQALPETVKFYPVYAKNKSAIDNHVVQPFAQSWFAQWESKSTGLSAQENRYCKQGFEQKFHEELAACYKK